MVQENAHKFIMERSHAGGPLLGRVLGAQLGGCNVHPCGVTAQCCSTPGVLNLSPLHCVCMYLCEKAWSEIQTDIIIVFTVSRMG